MFSKHFCVLLSFLVVLDLIHRSLAHPMASRAPSIGDTSTLSFRDKIYSHIFYILKHFLLILQVFQITRSDLKWENNLFLGPFSKKI